MSDVPLNVLLLLSYDQLPPPDEELSELVDACAKDGEVYFATTRNISSLMDGAEVAFYADGPDKHAVLATATFRSFMPIESAEATSVLASHPLYGSRHPNRMRGLARLSSLVLRDAGTTIDSLGGWIVDGRRLSRDGLPSGHAGASVYYVKRIDGGGPSVADRLRLAQSKSAELEDKYADTRRLWNQEVARRKELHKLETKELRALIRSKTPTSQPAQVGGRGGKLANLLILSYQAIFPSVRILKDGAETLLDHYTESRSLVERLAQLNADPMLKDGLRGGKAVVSASGWFEARFGDDLGRLYYRRVGAGREARVVVLVSQKNRQDRDVRYLRSLKDANLEKL
jgi:hypothetical protein